MAKKQTNKKIFLKKAVSRCYRSEFYYFFFVVVPQRASLLAHHWADLSSSNPYIDSTREMKSMGSILICMIQSCSPWLGDRKGEPHPQPNSIGDLILYVLNSKLCFKAVHNFHVHSSTLQERSRQLTGVHPPFLSLTSYSEMSAELSVAGVGPGSL